MDSEHHGLHTRRCPCALGHVSSEESTGTQWGWACSPPSTPSAPSPRQRQSQGHHHHRSLIRGGSYRLRLREMSP